MNNRKLKISIAMTGSQRDFLDDCARRNGGNRSSVLQELIETHRRRKTMNKIYIQTEQDSPNGECTWSLERKNKSDLVYYEEAEVKALCSVITETIRKFEATDGKANKTK